MFVFGLLLALTATSDAAPAEPPPGVTYSRRDVPEVPWSIHLVIVDRHRTDLRWVTTMGAGTQLGMSVVSEQIKAVPADCGKPVAAINGDFFHSSRINPGDPEGAQISCAELISAPCATRSCLWIDAQGQCHMTNVVPAFTVTFANGTQFPVALNEERTASSAVLYTSAIGPTTRCAKGTELILERPATNAPWLPLQISSNYTARVRQVNNDGDSPLNSNVVVLSVGPALAAKVPALKPGDTLQFSTATQPSMAGAVTAIGGGPALVRDGKAATFKGIQPRHPRSAVGWNNDLLFLVEVDGRQRTSAGMSLAELATYMANLGCTEALNLDGGGSATLWFNGAVVNSPSEGRERPAANALVLVHDPKPKIVKAP